MQGKTAFFRKAVARLKMIGRKSLYWATDKNSIARDMVYPNMSVAKPDDNIVDILRIVDENTAVAYTTIPGDASRDVFDISIIEE